MTNLPISFPLDPTTAAEQAEPLVRACVDSRELLVALLRAYENQGDDKSAELARAAIGELDKALRPFVELEQI